MTTEPYLSIVTVVFNDWPGLDRTLRSVAAHRAPDVEHWIIDGSNDGEVARRLTGRLPTGTYLLSEPDDGLYDAMNKGLDRSSGGYVLFLNAGDELHSDFTVSAVKGMAGASGSVLLGYSVEQWRGDSYLRPGIGQEANALRMPAHQATFYPRQFYATNRYRLDRPIGADGVYTAAAAKDRGAIFIPIIVCRFELGGRSTDYTLRSIRARFREYPQVKHRVQILVKAALWFALPQGTFYRVMARGKFTRLTAKPAPVVEKPILLGR